MERTTMAGSDPTLTFDSLNLDLSVESMTDAEKARASDWLDTFRVHRGKDLGTFARFQLAFDPGAWKRLWRHLLALQEDMPDDPLPLVGAALMWVHTYTALGKGKEALYESIAARDLGSSRAEVLEAIALAWLHGGPAGLNPLAQEGFNFFEEWQDGGVGVTVWPIGWKADPNFFRSGMDLETDDLSSTELDHLQSWYRSVYGDVPAYLPVLARRVPKALKTQRVRFERAYRGVLPLQLVTLFSVHHAAVAMHEHAIRRATLTALAAGVSEDHLMQTVFWAAVYGGETVIETVHNATADLGSLWR